MSINSKMTALADEIRELSGTTTPKGIDAMTTDVNTANIEISEQTDLIAQIKEKVNNLPAAGSGGSAIETCTININTQYIGIYNCFYITLENGQTQLSSLNFNNIATAILTNVVKGSIFVIKSSYVYDPVYNTSDNAVVELSHGREFWTFYIGSTASDEINLTIIEND